MELNKHETVDLLEASYLNRSKSKQLIQQKGWEWGELSTNEAKVISKNGQPYILYRGTQPWRTRDLISDLAIGVGAQSFDPRFRAAQRQARRVKRAYGREPIGVGHSLGGSLAQFATETTYTYGAGKGLRDMRETRKKGKEWVNPFDPVSFLGDIRNKSFVWPKLWNPHSFKNLL